MAQKCHFSIATVILVLEAVMDLLALPHKLLYMYILYLMFLPSLFFFLISSLCQGNLSARVLHNIHRLRFEAHTVESR